MGQREVIPEATGDVAALCAEIRRLSEEEAGRLVETARRHADELLRKAREEAEARTRAIGDEAEARARKARERILASAQMDRRRAVLEERMVYVGQVLDEIGHAVERLRLSPEYRRFLLAAIRKASGLVGPSVEVVVSRRDAGLADATFRTEAEEACRQAGASNVRFSVAECDDAGVIVRSADGRIVCDCRIPALLAGRRDAIVDELLKEEL